MPSSRWTIRGPRKDGTFELYGDGEWWETFPDRESADKELLSRQQLETIRSQTHAKPPSH